MKHLIHPKRFIRFFVDYCATHGSTRQIPLTLDRKDTRFKKLHGTCNVVFRTLHQSGIGTKKTSASVIADEDEERLWKAGVMNTTTPIGLQRTVFYYIGKACYLRGGEEQRGLKPSQFAHLYDPDRYVYTENGSKNRNGGFYQLGIDNKSVPIFENVDAGERCTVVWFHC